MQSKNPFSSSIMIASAALSNSVRYLASLSARASSAALRSVMSRMMAV
ncbi:MAG: hypothetical protein NTU88_07265 [Armatimonadetes bacterium]|nr:hypothetical protein [Armatimonadota bacterium]